MPTTSTTITEQERAKRAQALVAAAGHLRLEDLHLDEELMRILQRHADGEIGDEELCAAVDELNHRRLGPMASSGNGSPPSEGAEEQVRVQATFDDLVKKWRRETRHFLLIVVGRVTPAKGNLTVGQSDEAVVGDGDAMSIAAEILQDVLGSASSVWPTTRRFPHSG